jgi:PHD/YefM family antitoxin component YafN of YafNO toxin-antitoxin module
MKSIDFTEAEARLDDVLEEAQRQPVVIRREGADYAIVLSMREYELLRADSIRAFLALRNDAAREAIEAGITEEVIDRLLSDD